MDRCDKSGFVEGIEIPVSDIASELGLSTAAVSYVLHGKTGMVSERTAVRVRRPSRSICSLPHISGINVRILALRTPSAARD